MESNIVKNKTVLAAGIISLAILIGVGMYTHNTKGNKSFVTTVGHARKVVTSDVAVLQITLSKDSYGSSYGEDAVVNQNKAATDFADVQKTADAVVKLFQDKGIPSTEINVSNKSETREVSATVRISSKDVQKVTDAYKSLGDIIAKASKDEISVSSEGPVYSFTKIDSVRAEMFKQALDDSRQNAEAITKVGKLDSATYYVRLASPNSTNIDSSSDKYMYDTPSTLEKELVVEVQATYLLK